MNNKSIYITIPDADGDFVLEGIQHLDEVIIRLVAQKEIVTLVDGLYSDMTDTVYDMKWPNVHITVKADGSFNFFSLSTGNLTATEETFNETLKQIGQAEGMRINNSKQYIKQGDTNPLIGLIQMFRTEFSATDAVIDTLIAEHQK